MMLRVMSQRERSRRAVEQVDPERAKEASWLTLGVCVFFVVFLALLLLPLIYFLTHYRS
jgi:Na+-driven multidrug efflux pump